jgi:amino acid adenylation domain-containing protein
VEAQSERTPDAVAVIADFGVATEMTYRELNQKADALAVRLQGLGVGTDTPVVVMLDRSAELMVALLGVLKSGGAYVPVDPGLPERRRAFMIEDSGASVLLTQAAHRDKAPDGPEILAVDEIWPDLVDGDPEPRGGPDSLAYIIYTSGSTGTPKGVMIEHRSIVNQLLWMREFLGLGEEDVILQKTPISFDTSVEELFSLLILGGAVVMAYPDGHKDPAYLIRTIRERGVTMVDFVPSMLQALVVEPELGDCSTLRYLFSGGEALTPALRDEILDALDVELFNWYGPTEAAVQVTSHSCKKGDPPRTVPIGRPVANTRLYVLDRNGEPVPMGVAGELHIGGVQVARGYLNRPDLTAEMFVPDPFTSDESARLYKTGDLCQFRPDGEIECLGRIDHQVKIRGFRIELGEIEAALEGQAGIRQAVVDVKEMSPNDQALVAYLMPDNGRDPDTSVLAQSLSDFLPEYMVPKHWVVLPEIPLNPSGKVDRLALPVPERVEVPEQEFVAPQTEIEEALAGIWAEVLGVPRVGAGDNFFNLGGHSILAIRVVSRIRRDLGVELPLRRMFATPVLRPLAEEIEGLAAAAAVTAMEDEASAYDEEVVI